MRRENVGCEGRGETGRGVVAGFEGTKASMPQNVDRERRVPLPLIHGNRRPFSRNSGVNRVVGTRGGMITVQ